MRKAVVFGLLHAGLAVTRSLGRAGVPVVGVAWSPHDFGLRSRYLTAKHLVEGDRAALDAVHAEAAGDRVVLFPDRDEHVEWALDHWDEVNGLADLPLPLDREAVVRLSLGTITAIALKAESPAEGIRATYCDSDVAAMFRMAMQCQIIDDVVDYRKDVSAGLPTFLTASASLPQAVALTSDASRSYAASRGSSPGGGVFPLEAALCVLTLVTKLVLSVARTRELLSGGVRNAARWPS